MKIRRFPLLGGATAVVALAAAVPALAGSPAVSVRVEGVNRTLLPATVVHGDAGSVTKGGTPAGTCPGSSGAGDLDAATHHNWAGTYSSGLGIEIEAILGETHKYSQNALRVGDLVTYASNDELSGVGIDLTHRIIGIRQTASGPVCTTKGDANNVADDRPVSGSAIIGTVWFHVPYVGWDERRRYPCPDR